MRSRSPASFSGESAEAVRYRLAGFEVDPAGHELSELTAAGQRRVELPPLAFRLLLHLIEHRDRVVLKDELFRALWGETAVSEGSLSQAVWVVRRALHDTGGAQQVIRSIRGRGYRLVADVEVLEGEPITGSMRVPAQGLGDSTLVGREVELLRMRDDLSEAMAGRGRICLLSGPPGMGKTRLANELLGAARLAGAADYECRCMDDESMPPCWPLQQVARALIEHLPLEDLPGLLGDGAGDLALLIPELREGLPELRELPPRALHEARLQLFDALSGLLQRSSELAPLVVVVEDVHWADDATLAFLRHVAPTIGRMRVLIVATLRTRFGGEACDATVESLQSHGATRIELRGLQARETALLMSSWGVEQPSPRLVARVIDLTGGNPFFVVNVARWLAAHPKAQLVESGVSLPHELRAVLRQLLSALPHASGELLNLLSVFGQSCHLSDLRRASELSSERALQLLEPAQASRVVVEDRDLVGTFHFAHPTIRETIYEGLPSSQRVRLHRAAARAIERAHCDDPTPRLAELAHHYYQAAASGNGREAIDYCRLAAERAYEATAYEEAVAHYRRALYALELQEPVDERERSQLLLGLGQALSGTASAPEDVRRSYAEAAEAARRADDTRLFSEAAMSHAGRGPMRLSMLRVFGTVSMQEIELLQEALGRLGPEDHCDRALLKAWLSHSLYDSGRREERLRLSREAVALARELGDRRVLAECLMLAQASARAPDDLPARIEMLGEIIQIAHDTGHYGLELDACYERMWANWDRADLQGAQADMLDVERLSNQLRQLRDKRLQIWRATRADDAGRFDEASRIHEEIELIGNVDQVRAVRDFVHLYYQGRSVEALPVVERWAERLPLVVAWRTSLAAISAEAGRMGDAERELDRLAVNNFAAIPHDHNWINAHVRCASAAWLLQDAPRCAVLYDKLVPYADRMCMLGLFGLSRGVVHKSLGELATVTGQYELAEQHLSLAIEKNERLGVRVWSAFARVSYAQLLLCRNAPGDAARAREQSQAALDFARTHGVPLLERQARDLLARIIHEGAP